MSSHRPIRIVIEGADLTGKTTVAEALTLELRTVGDVSLCKGRIVANPLHAMLEWFPAGNFARSALLNAGYLVASLFDGVLLALRRQPPIVLCESYVDRAIAWGVGGRLSLVPLLALRWPDLFVRFDIVVLLHAPLRVRRARLTSRGTPNEVDRVSVEPFMHRRMAAALRKATRRHGRILRFNTSAVSCERICRDVLHAVTEMIAERRAPGGRPRALLT
jgi:thymidylate kinase